jgi:cysteine desulfurase family protein
MALKNRCSPRLRDLRRNKRWSGCVEKLIYLDNAATAWPKPENVYGFMVDFYRQYGVNPGRSGFDLAIEAGNILEELRKRLTKFFGGDEDAPERLCFGYNATDSLNLIIQGLLEPGDHVITTNVEHNSVIRPVNHQVRDNGVESTYIPFDSHGFVDPDDIKRAFKPNTRLVIVNHGSNVIGTVQPVAKIGRICHEQGIIFAIDSSQTAGVVPINMREMNIDVLAFTGHKALMGCMGIGGMCVRKDVDIRITRSGGTGVESAYPYQLERYPYRMEFGTPNMVGVAALSAGQDWIEQEGLDNIYSKELRLARKLVSGLKEIDGVIIYCGDSLENHLSTISMNIGGLDAKDTGIMLDVDHNIAVRTGLHCAPLVHKQLGTDKIHGSVRFSIGAFNTEEDIDCAIKAVAEVAEFARQRVQ